MKSGISNLNSNNTRRAVGAIVCMSDQIVLVHKVMSLDGSRGPKEIPGEWDFPKGGIRYEDEVTALRREMREEIGIENFDVSRRLEDFKFSFSEEAYKDLGYSHQVTSMFLVTLSADFSSLKPNCNEIDDIGLFSYEEAINTLTHNTSKEYLRFIQNQLKEYVKC